MSPEALEDAHRQIEFMRFASQLEGVTLVLLLFVAVPVKFLADMHMPMTVFGPIHGFAFLLYFWLLAGIFSRCNWSSNERTRLILRAFVPFGTFLNDLTLRRQEVSLMRQRALG